MFKLVILRGSLRPQAAKNAWRSCKVLLSYQIPITIDWSNANFFKQTIKANNKECGGVVWPQARVFKL